MNKKLTNAKKFIEDHSIEIVSGACLATSLVAMYNIGKSRGAITLDLVFYPKGQPPVSVTGAKVR